MAHFGELLSELRQDRNMTQKELGEVICVSPGTISNYENGVHTPDPEKLVLLADFFHVTTDYLLGRTTSDISPEVLQQAVTDSKTMADVLNAFAKLPKNRQEALALIISDMEINHMINEYSRKDGKQ